MPRPDLRRPHPDVQHEATRQALLQALADLVDGLLLADVLFVLHDQAAADIAIGQADRDDHLLLLDALFGLVDVALAAVAGAAAERDELTARVDALEQRIAALESPPTSPPDEEVP